MLRNLFSCIHLKTHLNFHMRTSTFQSKLFKYLQESLSNSNSTEIKSEKVETVRNILKKFDHHEGSKPGSLVSSKLYVESMKQMVEMQSCLKAESLQKEDLVKILFYVGLQKKSPQAQYLIRLILSRLNNRLDTFTLEDTCILANAVFKTSTRKLDPYLIDHIRNTINCKFNTIIHDPSVLVCLIKIYRQYSIIDYDLLTKLSTTTDVWAKNFTVNAHILALFAEAKYHNEATLDILIQRGLHELRNNPPPTNNHLLRAKDVARYLWAISVLQGKLAENDVEDVIWTWLRKQLVLSTDFKKKPAVLLDSLLSLCILGHYSTELMAWLTSQETLYKLLDKNKIQPWVKLKLLQTAVQIERLDLIFEIPLCNKFIPEQTVQQHIEQRPALKRLLTALTGLAEVLSLSSATCQFQVPNLHIAGIVLYNHSDPVLHVELLDHSVCLHESPIPTGIMKLKLRLLNVNSQHVLQLQESELPQDDAEFYVYLEDQLRKELKHTYIT